MKRDLPKDVLFSIYLAEESVMLFADGTKWVLFIVKDKMRLGSEDSFTRHCKSYKLDPFGWCGEICRWISGNSWGDEVP